jgi:hypothetical protein
MLAEPSPLAVPLEFNLNLPGQPSLVQEQRLRVRSTEILKLDVSEAERGF